MSEILRLSISYSGSNADENEIDLYDISQALVGFQRSLALTTHLVFNDQIITQAPSLKGAEILALPSEEGSWKMTAVILVGAASAFYKLGTAPQNTPLGHLVYSAYDYVISETLGFHVDYDESLGKQYEELKKSKSEIPILHQYRLDALAEKCIKPIRDIHRPIYARETATKGKIVAELHQQKIAIGGELNKSTYEYVSYTETSSKPTEIIGRVSSYNSNTYKGRIYLSEEGRPIPFTLYGDSKSNYSVSLIANSLLANTQRVPFSEEGFIHCKAFKNKSKSGLLKTLNIVEVSSLPFL